jgi:hypothetical protein
MMRYMCRGGQRERKERVGSLLWGPRVQAPFRPFSSLFFSPSALSLSLPTVVEEENYVIV